MITLPLPGGEGTVDNQDIPGVNAGLPHGLPSHPDKEGCCRVLDEVLVEVQGTVEIVIGGGRIAGGGASI
jgi:hypothetical protein